MVPAGPAEQWTRVGGAAGAGVGDEPFLRHVELAAVRPVGLPEEVGADVLRPSSPKAGQVIGVAAGRSLRKALEARGRYRQPTPAAESRGTPIGP